LNIYIVIKIKYNDLRIFEDTQSSITPGELITSAGMLKIRMIQIRKLQILLRLTEAVLSPPGGPVSVYLLSMDAILVKVRTNEG
jgi:hypothetical protein